MQSEPEYLYQFEFLKHTADLQWIDLVAFGLYANCKQRDLFCANIVRNPKPSTLAGSTRRIRKTCFAHISSYTLQSDAG